MIIAGEKANAFPAVRPWGWCVGSTLQKQCRCDVGSALGCVVAQPLGYQSKICLLLFRRGEGSASIFAASVFMLLVQCCKKSPCAEQAHSCRSRRKNWYLCEIPSKINLPKSTDITMQETHRFYSLISLRHNGSIRLIQKILWMNKCSMNITWLHNFSLKHILSVQHHFLLNRGFPQILIMCSTSHTSLWLSLPPFFPRDSSDYNLKTSSFNITAASSLAYHSHCFLFQPPKYSLYKKEYKILVSVYSFYQYKRNVKLRKAFLSSR